MIKTQGTYTTVCEKNDNISTITLILPVLKKKKKEKVLEHFINFKNELQISGNAVIGQTP